MFSFAITRLEYGKFGKQCKVVVKWLYSEAKQDSSSTRHITPHFVYHLQQGCCSHQKRQDVESVSSDKSSDRKSRTKRIVNTLGQLLTHSHSQVS